jgi:AraC-like DNA-binding protein
VSAARAMVPLAHYNLFHTRDLDEARERVGQVFCPHGLTITGARDRFRTIQNHVDTGLVSLSYIDYGADVHIEPGELGSFYLIQVPIEGTAAIRTGARAFTADRGRASILNPTHHTAMTWHAGCRKLQVQVARATLDVFVRDHFGRDFDASIAFDPEMDLTRSECAAWLRQLVAYMRAIEQIGIGPDSSGRRDHYGAEILRGLIEAQPNSHAHFAEPVGAGPMPRYVKAAIDFIRAYADRPLTHADVAHAAGVPGRTLQYGFRRFVGSAPMKILRDERLDRCRVDLVQSRGSVSDVATTWGFQHLGRFASYYRDRFGETPGETARRA